MNVGPSNLPRTLSNTCRNFSLFIPQHDPGKCETLLGSAFNSHHFGNCKNTLCTDIGSVSLSAEISVCVQRGHLVSPHSTHFCQQYNQFNPLAQPFYPNSSKNILNPLAKPFFSNFRKALNPYAASFYPEYLSSFIELTVDDSETHEGHESSFDMNISRQICTPLDNHSPKGFPLNPEAQIFIPNKFNISKIDSISSKSKSQAADK